MHNFYMIMSSNGSFYPVTGPLFGNSPVTGEFPIQRSSNADFDVSLMWVRISCWTNSESNDRWFNTTWHSCDVIVMIQRHPYNHYNWCIYVNIFHNDVFASILDYHSNQTIMKISLKTHTFMFPNRFVRSWIRSLRIKSLKNKYKHILKFSTSNFWHIHK